jgi:hypothetical protein
MIPLPSLLLLPTIWIVDAQMGPGAQFADLPAAIAAAANGDTILVRAGTYSGFSVNGKALTLRGEGMATTRILASALGMTVEILNAGGVFVLSGLRLEGGLPAMIVQSSAVELLDCELVGLSGAGAGGPGLSMNLANVVAARCTFTGGSVSGGIVAIAGDGVSIAGASTFVADQCVFLGGDLPSVGGGFQQAGIGLRNSGQVRLDGCRARGGNGQGIAGAGVTVTFFASARIAGDATSYVAAGLASGQFDVALRNAFGSIVRHDPVAVVGGVSGTVVTSQPLPRLRLGGAVRADGTLDALQPVLVTLDGLVPNGFGFIGFGDPVFTAAAPPFATELLVGGAGSTFFVAPLDALGRLQFAYTPALIGGPLVGVPVHLQGGAWSPALGSVLTSNLAVHIALP